MSRGAVNFHFGSKDDLLVAVSEQVTSDWESQVVAALEDGLDLTDVDRLIDATLSAWLGELDVHPDRVRIVVMLIFEALGPSPHLHQHFVELRRRLRDRVVAFVIDQQQSGRVAADVNPHGFATLLCGLLLGIAVTHPRRPRDGLPDDRDRRDARHAPGPAARAGRRLARPRRR